MNTKDNQPPKQAAQPAETTGKPFEGLQIDQAFLVEMITEAEALYKKTGQLNEMQKLAENLKHRIGPGPKLLGFIEKTKDAAVANPQFAPAYFNGGATIAAFVEQIDFLKTLQNKADMISESVHNLQLLTTKEAYDLALRFYNSIHDLAKRNEDSARIIYEDLRPYFDHATQSLDQPTRKAQKREASALIDGKKDGKMVIENLHPQATGGVHQVSEETPPERKVKKTTDEEIS